MADPEVEISLDDNPSGSIKPDYSNSPEPGDKGRSEQMQADSQQRIARAIEALASKQVGTTQPTEATGIGTTERTPAEQSRQRQGSDFDDSLFRHHDGIRGPGGRYTSISDLTEKVFTGKGPGGGDTWSDFVDRRDREDKRMQDSASDRKSAASESIRRPLWSVDDTDFGDMGMGGIGSGRGGGGRGGRGGPPSATGGGGDEGEFYDRSIGRAVGRGATSVGNAVSGMFPGPGGMITGPLLESLGALSAGGGVGGLLAGGIGAGAALLATPEIAVAGYNWMPYFQRAMAQSSASRSEFVQSGALEGAGLTAKGLNPRPLGFWRNFGRASAESVNSNPLDAFNPISIVSDMAKASEEAAAQAAAFEAQDWRGRLGTGPASDPLNVKQTNIRNNVSDLLQQAKSLPPGPGRDAAMAAVKSAQDSLGQARENLFGGRGQQGDPEYGFRDIGDVVDIDPTELSTWGTLSLIPATLRGHGVKTKPGSTRNPSHMNRFHRPRRGGEADPSKSGYESREQRLTNTVETEDFNREYGPGWAPMQQIPDDQDPMAADWLNKSNELQNFLRDMGETPTTFITGGNQFSEMVR